jgi:dTDP-4-dehydrorhamnose 3,5-epimerase
MPLTAHSLEIPDVLVLEPEIHEDVRGHFFEAWNQERFDAAVGEHVTFVQDNHSMSRAGVVRGLHYQVPDAQGKLVRVISGAAFTVAVDIRKASATFGRWVAAELSAENHRQLWVPPGLAHGFMALRDTTEYLYKVTAKYAPGCDRVIRWNDPAIGIDWPQQHNPVLTAKDRVAPLLADAEVFD